MRMVDDVGIYVKTGLSKLARGEEEEAASKATMTLAVKGARGKEEAEMTRVA